jgi:hypothetical protein
MAQGANPKAVQMLLGHSSPAYTLATYVHPQVDDLRALLADNNFGENREKSGIDIAALDNSALESGSGEGVVRPQIQGL